jgi:hypothetical protein
MDILMSLIQALFIVLAYIFYRSNKSKFSLLILSYFTLWPVIEFGSSYLSISSSPIPELVIGLVFAASYLLVIKECFEDKTIAAIALLAHVAYSFLYITSSSSLFAPYVGSFDSYGAGYFAFTFFIEVFILFEAWNARDTSNSAVSSHIGKVHSSGIRHAK